VVLWQHADVSSGRSSIGPWHKPAASSGQKFVVHRSQHLHGQLLSLMAVAQGVINEAIKQESESRAISRMPFTI
jgi:hypothetical protein